MPKTKKETFQMKIVIAAEGNDLSAPASPRFGRCSTYIFVETETMAVEAQPNPAVSASGGAGTQAAQFIVEQGVGAVLAANVGPNAMQVLLAASVPVYAVNDGSVREAVEAYKAGKLERATQANVREHAGMESRQDRPRALVPLRKKEIAALRARAAGLRQQLAEVLEAIEKLEKEN
jgi:predicted Fe-Mo cluster-binding NifX family protein